MGEKIQEAKIGKLRTALWKNLTKDGRAFYSVSLERGYKVKENGKPKIGPDGKEVWENQRISIPSDQLPALASTGAHYQEVVCNLENQAAKDKSVAIEKIPERAVEKEKEQELGV